MADRLTEPNYDAIVIGAGVVGIYSLHKLLELGFRTTVLEAGGDLGGTWYWNRYPGARFDSESYTYTYSFSKEALAEWDWKERFSGQPETLRYLQYVADKHDLRRHMQFDCTVESAHWDEDGTLWRLHLADGRDLTCRYLITALGILSAPTMPRLEGIDDFQGLSFHTSSWPAEHVDLAGKRVGIIGTGATGIQVIGEIADKVGELTVFQRRPNWASPLRNGEIPPEEMADIKSRYDAIFELCARTPQGFIHQGDPRPYFEVPKEERFELFERLYQTPGFAIWLGNFVDIFYNEEANKEFSEFIANKIRSRVNDPVVAEKLIPKDHGFGFQRVPMETRYYEAYNRDNVHLVDLRETPLERVTPKGLLTTEREYELDIIIYATGFDAITGAYDRIDIRGVGGQPLKAKWADGPQTYLGVTVAGFPNMLMPVGPQTGSIGTNYVRGTEMGVDWVMKLLRHMSENGLTRVEATPEAEVSWTAHVAELYSGLLMTKGAGWFIGYNSNVEGHQRGAVRYMTYQGGTPAYRQLTDDVAADGFRGFTFSELVTASAG